MPTSIRIHGAALAQRYDHEAFQILRFAFTVAPILARADRFFHLLGARSKSRT